ADAVEGNPLLLGDGKVLGEDDRRRAVDGHRGGDRGEVDAIEKVAHVLDRVDGDSAVADLAEGLRLVAVTAHQGRHVEGDAEPGLSLSEQEAVALVRLLRAA